MNPSYYEDISHHFDYDEHERLTAYRVTSLIFNIESHRYKYSGNRIVIDTIETGSYADVQAKALSKLTYDDKSRIINRL